MSSSCNDWIEFDNPKSLDEVLRKARLCFEQYKQRNDTYKVWKDRSKKYSTNKRKDLERKGMARNRVAKNTSKAWVKTKDRDT